MEERARGRVAVVTGAGRGIGRAVALELARKSFALCIAARTRHELEETRRLSGLAPNRSLIVLADLAQREGPQSLFSAALEHFGRIDVIVNNAGWAPPRTPIVSLAASDEERVIAVNLRAPLALARMAAAQMQKQGGGTIINIASSAGRTAPAGEAVYAAAKAGLIAFTHAAFKELRERGIKVAVVIPGLADTGLVPANRRLVRSAMLAADDVAAAVMQVIDSPARVCPLEIVLEPQRDPMRG